MDTIKSIGYLDIIYDKDSNALISQWHGGFQGRDLRAGLNTGLEEYKKRAGSGCQWIGDTTDIGVISKEDQEWINTDWFPRFLGTGVKYMAVVQPASAVAKMSVNSIVSKVAGTDLTVYNCASLDEARKWMKEQNK